MRKEWGWYSFLKGNESESRAVGLGSLNGLIGVFVSSCYIQLHAIFGLFVLGLALLSLVGVILVMMRKYASGAIFMGFSGVCFFPIGIIGIAAAKIAWTYTDRYKKKNKTLRKSRIARRGLNQ